jgi:Tfp pilus assembly protein FimT
MSAWESPHRDRGRKCGGYTLTEALITLSIMLVVAAAAVPRINAAVASYRLNSAVASISGAIQGVRYRAIYQGCSSALALDKTTRTYQVSSKNGSGSCAASFSNVGGAVPFASTAIQLGQNTSLQFTPGGTVTAPVGSNTITLTDGTRTKTLQVSSYGNISVTP